MSPCCISECWTNSNRSICKNNISLTITKENQIFYRKRLNYNWFHWFRFIEFAKLGYLIPLGYEKKSIISVPASIISVQKVCKFITSFSNKTSNYYIFSPWVLSGFFCVGSINLVCSRCALIGWKIGPAFSVTCVFDCCNCTCLINS